MKVGDLVGAIGVDDETYLALVIVANTHETLIKWLDDDIVEDADNYALSLEVFSESR